MSAGIDATRPLNELAPGEVEQLWRQAHPGEELPLKMKALSWYSRLHKGDEGRPLGQPFKKDGTWIGPIPGLEDFEPDHKDKSGFDNSLKDFIRGFSAERAVLELTVKEPKRMEKGSELKFQCPNPHDGDDNPSASINYTTKEWYCHKPCGAAGKDTISLYAVANGHLPVGGDYAPGGFDRMMEELGARYGMPSGAPTPRGDVSDPVAPEHHDDDLIVEESTDEPLGVLPKIDLDEIVPNKSGFIRAFCDAASVDDSPREFHFWTAMLGPGLAVGRNVTDDDSPNVTANLSVCLVAGTGTGKTRGMRFITKIIENVMPWDEMDPQSGVWIEKNPRSGEALLDGFIASPVNPSPSAPVNPTTKTIAPVPVRGLITTDELSTFISASRTQNSTIKDVIQEFSDGSDRIQTGSRGSGRKVARDCFGSILTTTQPDSLRRLLNRDDLTTGFANRFFYPYANKVKRNSRGGIAPDFTAAEEAMRKIRDWGSAPKVLEWTKDAIDLWDDVFQSEIVGYVESQPILVRFDLLLKRIALILAIDDLSDVVEVEHIHRALKLKDYILTCFEMTAQAVLSNDNREIHEFVETQVRNLYIKNKKGLTVADLVRNTKKYTKEELADACDWLVKRSIINKVDKEGGRGRKATWYVPNH